MTEVHLKIFNGHSQKINILDQSLPVLLYAFGEISDQKCKKMKYQLIAHTCNV